MSATHTTTQDNTPEPNREAWLMAAAEELWPRIIEAGGTRPARFRVSCGWPSSSPLRRASSSKRTLGEAWHGGSADEAREVFISPALAMPVEVLDVLAHEMVHAACKPGTGHGPVFAAIARKAGLTEGKPTTAAAGPQMIEELAELAKHLGRYPHAKLDRDPTSKQRARLMKGLCPDCGYVIRVTRTWIEVGMPLCPCGARMESVEYEPEGEPLKLAEAHVTYTTTDGRFRVQTSKTAGRDGKWYVIEEESGRMAIRQNRADALAFIEAVREGLTDFPALDEPEADADLDLELEELDDDLGDWTDDEGEYLDEDEDEVEDNPQDDEVEPYDEQAYEAETAKREAAGERKRLAIAAGAEGAMD